MKQAEEEKVSLTLEKHENDSVGKLQPTGSIKTLRNSLDS